MALSAVPRAAANVTATASKQMWWLQELREAASLQGPPPAALLKSLTSKNEENGHSCSSRTAASHGHQDAAEELLRLGAELEEERRKASRLQDTVDVLRSRCEELEVESQKRQETEDAIQRTVDLEKANHELEERARLLEVSLQEQRNNFERELQAAETRQRDFVEQSVQRDVELEKEGASEWERAAPESRKQDDEKTVELEKANSALEAKIRLLEVSLDEQKEITAKELDDAERRRDEEQAVAAQRAAELEQLNRALEETSQKLEASLKELEEAAVMKIQAAATRHDEDQASAIQKVSELEEAKKCLEEKAQKLEADLQGLKDQEAHRTQQNAQLAQQVADLVETQKTMEATHHIRLEGLQERCESLESQNADLVAKLSGAADLDALPAMELLGTPEEATGEMSLADRCAHLEAQKDELRIQLEESDDARKTLEVHHREEAEKMQTECDLLRSKYATLEADHSGLVLQAQEALGSYAALSQEHDRLKLQVNEQRTAAEVEDLHEENRGLKQQCKAFEEQARQLRSGQAEQAANCQAAQQETEFHRFRHDELKADAERLRGETIARADERKQLTAELDALRISRASLEANYRSLEEKAKEQKVLLDGSAEESQKQRDEIAKLRKQVSDLTEEGQSAAEEAERLRGDASDLEAVRRATQKELDELHRQSELWSAERGVMEAEAARLRATNEAVMADNSDLMRRLQSLAPKPESEEAYLACLQAAEQWVLYHAGLPLEGSCLPYLQGVTIQFDQVFPMMAPQALASPPEHLGLAAAAVESGELARASLQAFRLFDGTRAGELAWDTGEVQDFVDSIFHRRRLPPPSQDAQILIFDKFDEEKKGKLCAQDCLCFVDALFRALLLSPASLAVRTGKERPKKAVTGSAKPESLQIRLGQGEEPESGQAAEAHQLQEDAAQARLQRRLDEAERAAERALDTAASCGLEGSSKALRGEPAAQVLSGKASQLSPLIPGRAVIPPRAEARMLDPSRVSQVAAGVPGVKRQEIRNGLVNTRIR